MRNTKAKRLRKQIYGDKSRRAPRQYLNIRGTLVLDPKSLRAQYKNLKQKGDQT